MHIGLTNSQKKIKRIFDIICSFIGLLLLGVPIIFFIVLSSIIFKTNGLFKQQRVGQNGKLFTIYKIRSIPKNNTQVKNKFGFFLRKYKIDELPQFFNVIIGDMSLVGPRPDIVGYADELVGGDRIILSVKPGITGPASLYFKNEEEVLIKNKHLKEYNRNVIWPRKIALNKQYIENYSFNKDIIYIFKTILFLKNA